MAKPELRKAISGLMDEKSTIDIKLNEIKDKYTLYQTQLQELRNEQFGYREAKEHLNTSNSNKPARRVFDQKIAEAQMNIDEILKQIDGVEKDRVVWASRSKAMEKSIKELQSA